MFRKNLLVLMTLMAGLALGGCGGDEYEEPEELYEEGEDLGMTLDVDYDRRMIA